MFPGRQTKVGAERRGGAGGGVTLFDGARVRMRQRALGNRARSFQNSEYIYAAETMQLVDVMLGVSMFSSCGSATAPVSSSQSTLGNVFF